MLAFRMTEFFKHSSSVPSMLGPVLDTVMQRLIESCGQGVPCPLDKMADTQIIAAECGLHKRASLENFGEGDI